MSKGIDNIRFTEGPCDDSDEPELIKNMRRAASLRARKRAADKNLDQIRRSLCNEAFAVIGGRRAKSWSDEEIDVMCAVIELALIHLCNGGLFDANLRPGELYFGSRVAH